MPKELAHASRQLTADERDQLTRRALAAWLTTDTAPNQAAQGPTPRIVTKQEPDGDTVRLLHFVVLEAGGTVVACYRVRNDNLLLRRMRRPPKDLG